MSATGISEVEPLARPRPVTRRAALILLTVSCLLPVTVLIVLVNQHWVNVPWMDEWDISTVFDHYHEGDLTPRILTAYHNESRELFPRLIILFLGQLTDYDVRWDMGVTILLALLTSMNLYLLLKRHRTLLATTRLCLFGLINLFVFSPVQWNNWLHGMQLSFLIPPFFLTAGLLVNTSRLPLHRKILVASLLALVSSFSFANGLFLWLLLIPLDLLSDQQSLRTCLYRKEIGAPMMWYVAVAACALLCYLSKYYRLSEGLLLSTLVQHPYHALLYFLRWLGSPLVPEYSDFSGADTEHRRLGLAHGLRLLNRHHGVARSSGAIVA